MHNLNVIWFLRYCPQIKCNNDTGDGQNNHYVPQKQNFEGVSGTSDPYPAYPGPEANTLQLINSSGNS